MLLRTRFYIPPLKPDHLVRTELMQALQQSRGGELVLISAPAGYGKTTLVSQWLHTHSHSFAWLIVDAQQTVAEVFWQHVIGALQTLVPDMGEQALNLLSGQGVEASVISLLNDLDRLDIAQESDHAYTLVMDDLHKAESDEILSSLNLFLDHLPPSLRIVMTVRQDPALALARRRANGQLIEIQQQDLAFNSTECQHFLQKKLKTKISAEFAEDLINATEGWITGIQLSAMSSLPALSVLPAQGDKGQEKKLNRDMADYLFEEVFSQQPKALQNFLLSTAGIEKFCPALTNALCEIDGSYHVIKQLEAANLFIIALDNHRSWYRYHDLFRQFLLLQLQDLPNKKQNILHSRALDWFENSGYYEQAFPHAIALQDWSKCERLFSQIAEEKKDLGLTHSLVQFLPELPIALAEALIQQYQLDRLPTNKPIPALADLVEPLTKREAQVMALVQQGLSNKDIAEQLHISLNTLKVHIRNLYGKMGVENRTQALLKMAH